MSEQEITATIEAIAFRLGFKAVARDDTNLAELPATTRAALYGAYDALEIELRRVRALRPAL